MPIALKAVRKGGRVVCAGIHMSDVPSFGAVSVAATAGIGEDYADVGAVLCQSLSWIGIAVGTAQSISRRSDMRFQIGLQGIRARLAGR
jgi:acetate kinase